MSMIRAAAAAATATAVAAAAVAAAAARALWRWFGVEGILMSTSLYRRSLSLPTRPLMNVALVVVLLMLPGLVAQPEPKELVGSRVTVTVVDGPVMVVGNSVPVIVVVLGSPVSMTVVGRTDQRDPSVCPLNKRALRGAGSGPLSPCKPLVGNPHTRVRRGCLTSRRRH